MTQITDNLDLIIIGIIILIVFLYGIHIVSSVIRRRIRIRNSNREISLLKMDLLSKQAHLENLIEDSVLWFSKDLSKYDDTMKDNKILKSKLDTGMTIADTRTKRIELTNETAELFETLDKIKQYEDRMFYEGLDRRGRK